MASTNGVEALGEAGRNGAPRTPTAGGVETAPARVQHGLQRALARVTNAVGQHYLRRLQGTPGKLNQTLGVIPERMHRAAEQSRLVIELLDDVRTGNYRQLSWYSVPVAAAAFLYAVSPADVVPDVIPILGSLDDIALVTIAVRLLRRDLRAYCRFKGYPEERFFDPE
jgi:uncharacterized membrane protein YkvA (DUF1232 family)